MDIYFDIKVVPDSGKDPGNGFAIFNCPEIIHGQSYKKGSSLDYYKVPTMPQDQGMYALGQAGGNLGASDMVGLSGGYIATHDVFNGIVNDNNYYGYYRHAWSQDRDKQVYTDYRMRTADRTVSLNTNNDLMYQMMTWPDSNILNNIGWGPVGPGTMNFEGGMIPYYSNFN